MEKSEDYRGNESFSTLALGNVANQGKHAAKYHVCMGIQRQIISLKFKFCNICELKTHDTRKTTLLINLRNVAVLESV